MLTGTVTAATATPPAASWGRSAPHEAQVTMSDAPQVAQKRAPGVYLVPEAGYLDKMDNFAGDDEGYQWYAGAKWQIDF